MIAAAQRGRDANCTLDAYQHAPLYVAGDDEDEEEEEEEEGDDEDIGDAAPWTGLPTFAVSSVAIIRCRHVVI